mgnify:CR=1 FL=1|jgi:hypothetical protein
MIVRCVAELPSSSQARALGARYRPGKQAFGIIRGQQYVVFAVRALDGQLWIDIMDDDLVPGYLFGAPLCLFELVDCRVSGTWELHLRSGNDYEMAPPSLFREYYHDDLFEGVQEVVDDFLEVRRRLYTEAGIESGP